MEATEYPVINVLFALHPGMDALDFIGPLEVLSHAQHNKDDECKTIVFPRIKSFLSFTNVPPSPMVDEAAHRPQFIY